MSITALLRLGDEREFIEPCIRSIAWMDNLFFAYQEPVSTVTMDIANAVCDELGLRYHVAIYPYESRPNGPGHDKQPYDVYNRAYFYNWCYKQALVIFNSAKSDYFVKWDGDMVAHEWLEKRMRLAEASGRGTCTFAGTNIVGDWMYRPGACTAAYEPRMFRMQHIDPWKTGRMSEAWNLTAITDHYVEPHAYLHFKWAKNWDAAVRAWPTNWREMDHFQRIASRADECGLKPYKGEVPSVMKIRKYS